MKPIIVTTGQSLIDIAIQEYGCYEGIGILLIDNSLEFNDNLNPGQTLLVRNEVPKLTANNQAIAIAFKTDSVRVNSSDTTINEEPINTGFDYDFDFELI